MLPVDGRQLENVKGELLKLKKKEAADCPTMAQRGQDRRAEGTDEQRNSRLSAMVQHAREHRLNVIEGIREERKENTFWGERNVHVSDNICKKINRRRAYEN
ncbi:hypothetical protein AVEN_128500-1 [Araneus ventricosus]|uniref:Uncharacterized protein n=1 Tax=Araneus ventricosus TaxID=182803 RepID=A0A4Y2QZ03_ARAVE|nr:hypothetical protein AVEN_128500-1 [Araneus ventricosus]